MATGTDLVSAGNFAPVRPKHCACGAEGEWPGRMCPTCAVLPVEQRHIEPTNALSAVSIRTLAQYLRDKTWVDLRTDDGVITRVRICEIIVRLEVDDVTLFQQWFDADDQFRKRYFGIDAESIRKVTPCTCELAEVEPYGIPRPTAPPADPDFTVLIVAEILRCTCFLNSIKLDQLRKTSDWRLVEIRYTALVVLYEMTDLSPLACCEAVGYRSQTPWIIARWQHRDLEFSKGVVRLGDMVETQLGNRPRPRRSQLPDNYHPVLTR